MVLKWFVAEADSDSALRFLAQQRELIAPTLLLAELANALWLKWRRSMIPPEIADEALDDVPRYFTRLVPTGSLLHPAMRLSRSMDRPIYDCCYLALAMNENAVLVTADRGLLQAAMRLPQPGYVQSLAEVQ